MFKTDGIQRMLSRLLLGVICLVLLVGGLTHDAEVPEQSSKTQSQQGDHEHAEEQVEASPRTRPPRPAFMAILRKTGQGIGVATKPVRSVSATASLRSVVIICMHEYISSRQAHMSVCVPAIFSLVQVSSRLW